MYLLNIETMKLESISNLDTAPQYAILSHTWASGNEDELIFQDWGAEFQEKAKAAMVPNTPDGDYGPRRRNSGRKIIGFCRKALSFGVKYGWIDTICIDKRNSAELSEAINSMWMYYRRAAICIAYFADIDEGTALPDDGTTWNSRWFTRGWTLQELLAPREVLFFTSAWKYLGARSTLGKELSRLTKIPEEIFGSGYRWDVNDDDESSSTVRCVAEKLSWASRRETTREEDRAYSLMGLFGVNMPVLYGEGFSNAFHRLQAEIFLATGDHSIFVWSTTTPSLRKNKPHPASPSLFAPFLENFDFSDHQVRPIFIPRHQEIWDLLPREDARQNRGISRHRAGLPLQLATIAVDHELQPWKGPQTGVYHIALLPITLDKPEVAIRAGLVSTRARKLDPEDIMDISGIEAPTCLAILLKTRINSTNDFTRVVPGSENFEVPDLFLTDMLTTHFRSPIRVLIRDVYVPSRLPPGLSDNASMLYSQCQWTLRAAGDHFDFKRLCTLNYPKNWMGELDPLVFGKVIDANTCQGQQTFSGVVKPGKVAGMFAELWDTRTHEGLQITYILPPGDGVEKKMILLDVRVILEIWSQESAPRREPMRIRRQLTKSFGESMMPTLPASGERNNEDGAVGKLEMSGDRIRIFKLPKSGRLVAVNTRGVLEEQESEDYEPLKPQKMVDPQMDVRWNIQEKTILVLKSEMVVSIMNA